MMPQTTVNPTSPGIAFRAPGNPSATSQRPYITVPASKRALGIVRMAPDSAHQIAIGGRKMYVTCRDRRDFPNATGFYFCLHESCRGKSWPSDKAMTDAHGPPSEMIAREEVHLVGFWSNDDCNPPADNCAACELATKAASGAATKEARAKNKDAPEAIILRACDEHSGGAVGLLTPTDPNA